MVEKTWHFNDRIQKAQEILTGLITNISVIPTSDPLIHSTTVDSSVLEVKNDIIMNSEMVELTYIDDKEITDGDFLHEEGDPMSDISDKPEIKKKVTRIRNKVGNYYWALKRR